MTSWTDDETRVKERRTERKSLLSLLIIGSVFAITLLLRRSDGAIPPFDDLYHLKRITFAASHFPHVLDFDTDRGDRGAFCPWPPLYDLTLGGVMKVFGGVAWAPPIFFALFVAGVTAAMMRFGALAAATAGLTLALSPYLIGASSAGHIDHHYVEPLLIILIMVTAARRNGILLGLAIAMALLVQTALLVAAGVAFIAIFFSEDTREGAKAFAIAAAIILLYRLTRPPAYPSTAWFLGYPHIALLIAAAIACALVPRVSRPIALAAGAAVALTFPQTISGLRFFGGDPWLSSIIEFQPMFNARGFLGTDLANLGGGALFAPLLWRKQRTVALFAIVYLLLALSSRRFLVPATTLFAVGGALFLYGRRFRPALIAAGMMILPPLVYDIATAREPEPSHDEYRVVGRRLLPLPRGRVLAPWSFGHAIDVIGQKPVVIDNFGSMPDAPVFTNALEAMLSTRESQLLAYCRDRGVRYLVFPHPAYVPATAATIGIDPQLYLRTRLARRTVWSRLYLGEHIAGFVPVSDGAISIWKIE